LQQEIKIVGAENLTDKPSDIFIRLQPAPASSMSETAKREWLFRQFQSALRALAADGEAALSTLRENCARPDELALDFDNYMKATVGNFRSEFSAVQLETLSRISIELGGMSGMKNAELWTEDAVRNHPRWQTVRMLAKAALAELGWQNVG
jgi:hypothetical protein